MNSRVLLICLLVAGCALADDEITEKPTDAPAPEEAKVEETTTEAAANTAALEAAKETPAETPAADKKEESGEKPAPAPVETATGSGETKAENPAEAGKLGDLLNVATTGEPGTEDAGKNKDTPPAGEQLNSADDLKDKLNKASEPKTSGEKIDTQPRELKTSGEETAKKPENLDTDTAKKPETVDVVKKLADSPADTLAAAPVPVKPVETNPNPIVNVPAKVVGVPNTDNAGNAAQHVDVPPKSSYSAGNPKPPADHKMTSTEQRAFVCNLPISEGELCPMTINLEENVGISDPGANAYCNDVIAAPMGYHGFCVVLMKSDPTTGTPIYTRTCAYYDKERSKCSTNFLTTEAVKNSTQVKYTCDNGVTHYVPTSCVKRQKALTVE
uniref:Uncharacterized protein n=1 Tax=Cacopsylla melanoneura TaxID=428564 RepID=A0A8D9BSE8_9HEMI